MLFRRFVPLLSIVLYSIFATWCGAAEITLAPSKDTTIYEDAADVSNSAGEHLFSGATSEFKNSGLTRQALLAFDVASSIPAEAIITEVSLSLTVDGDGELLASDIGFICSGVNSQNNPPEVDLDGNGVVNLDDLQFWVEQLKNTFMGDTNLNGSVEFADFLTLSNQFGRLNPPDPLPQNFSGWSGGDFNCDNETTFADFLIISTNFGKSNQANANAVSVPEPSHSARVCFAAMLLCVRRYRIGARVH